MQNVLAVDQGIINCWVMESLGNHDMLHIMIVCIIIFQYLSILFYPVHRNESENNQKHFHDL